MILPSNSNITRIKKQLTFIFLIYSITFACIKCISLGSLGARYKYVSKIYPKKLCDKDGFLSKIVKSVRADDIALVHFARVIRASGSGPTQSRARMIKLTSFRLFVEYA